MSERIVLLGTGTCQIEPGRMASAVLLELEDLRVVFDFGRGTSQRLAGLGLPQDRIEHVVLSHFHPDHVSDLIPFLQAGSWSRTDPRGRDLNLYGPPGLASLWERMLGLFAPGDLVREGRFRVRTHEISEGSFRIASHEFRFFHLPPAGNHGLRFDHGGRAYALTGDSHFHEREVAFLRGVDLGVIDAGHISDQQIVELAAASGARRIVCSHLYRELDEQALQAAARTAGYAGSLVVGRDLMSFDI